MTDIAYDLHVHTTYSDGSDMREMAAAAADAGLFGVGFADHCILFEDEFGRRERFDLAETYERRREDIRALREATALSVFDGVEMSYAPDREDEIRSFLEAAAFDYAIGSVHFAGGNDFTTDRDFADMDGAARRAAVDRYFAVQEQMVESELFEVAGHIDAVQRVPALRGLPEKRHYERLADAFADSRTVPEINAGRVDREYGTVHPEPRFVDYLRDRGVAFTVGTDSHRPHELRDRMAALREGAFVADTYPV